MSLMMHAPDAAASNRRVEGDQPYLRIDWRVRFSVARLEQYNAAWSRGYTWTSWVMFGGRSIGGYCAPARNMRWSGLSLAGANSISSTAACRSGANVPT